MKVFIDDFKILSQKDSAYSSQTPSLPLLYLNKPSRTLYKHSNAIIPQHIPFQIP